MNKYFICSIESEVKKKSTKKKIRIKYQLLEQSNVILKLHWHLRSQTEYEGYESAIENPY